MPSWPRHSLIDVRRIPQRDGCDGLFGRRVGDLPVPAFGRIHPLSIDIKLTAIPHLAFSNPRSVECETAFLSHVTAGLSRTSACSETNGIAHGKRVTVIGTHFDYPTLGYPTESEIDFQIVAARDLLSAWRNFRGHLVGASCFFVRVGLARRTLHPHTPDSTHEFSLDLHGPESARRPV